MLKGAARIGDQRGHIVGDAETAFGYRQQHHATIRRQAAAIESGSDFLVPNGWKN